MRRVAIMMLLGVALCGCGQDDEKKKPTAPAPSAPAGTSSPSQWYRDRLLEIGAVPESQATGKGHKPSPNAIINGWINPRYADWNSYVPEPLRKELGIPKPPLTYDRYASFLLVDEYKRNMSPELYALMLFTLEQIEAHKIPIPHNRDLLRIYDARIGLEGLAARLMQRAPISPQDALTLFEQNNGDVRLVPLLKIPPNDKQYVQTLAAWSNKAALDIFTQFRIKQLLAKERPSRFREPLRDFIIKNVKSIKDFEPSPWPGWWKRFQMYKELVDIGDKPSWAAVNAALLNDPITETREQLLRILKTPQALPHVLETVLMLAAGRGSQSQAVSPCRSDSDERDAAAGYLSWALKQKTLSPTDREKINAALENFQKEQLYFI